jgi:transcription elongation GreA/GreB family factor
MNKESIVLCIVQQLSESLTIIYEAARTAHAAAIHEENIPDNKYATLGLEASYLAQAQANRAQEIKAELHAYKNLYLRQFDAHSPIRLTALVTLEGEDGSLKKVFIGPSAGGLKIDDGGSGVVIITADSPVGKALIGKTVGEMVPMGTKGAEQEFEIVSVC